MIRIKNKLYHKFLNTRKPGDLKKFRAHIHRLTKILRQAKKNYLHSLFNEATMSRVDRAWKIVNQVLNRSLENNSILEIKIGDRIFRGQKIAKSFNNYFANSVHSNHNPLSTSYLETRNESSAFFHPTDEYEVFNTFNSIQNSKSSDIDDIQIRTVKYVLDL